jgi:hypothetical protein
MTSLLEPAVRCRAVVEAAVLTPARRKRLFGQVGDVDAAPRLIVVVVVVVVVVV